LLAERTPLEVSSLLSRPPAELTEHTVTSVDALQAVLDQTRARGFALEREQNTPGLSCVSVVVPYRIPATDAISCSLPVASATDEELTRVAAVLTEHAHQLGARLRAEGIR
jgi:DNA-binding IclR family transcriptional regulator